MALASDPNAPFDVKRMVRAGAYVPSAGENLDFGNGGGPMTQATFAAPAAALGNASRRITGVYAGSASVPDNAPAQQPQGMQRAMVAGAHPTGIPDIQEQPTQYYVGDSTRAVPKGTPGAHAARVFTGVGQRNLDSGAVAGYQRGSPEWEAANSGQAATPEQTARNQLALSETRVIRGEGYDPTFAQGMQRAAAMSALGLGGMGGPGGTSAGGAFNPLTMQKTLTDIQSTRDADARANREQNINLQKDNETRANDLFKENLEAVKSQYSKLSDAEQQNAAHIRTAIALQNAGVDPETTSRGRAGMSLAGQRLAEYTNPVFRGADTVQPEQADLSKFDVVPHSGLGRRYTVQGPSFVQDPATGYWREGPGGERNETSGIIRSLPRDLEAGTSGDEAQLRGLIQSRRARLARDELERQSRLKRR